MFIHLLTSFLQKSESQTQSFSKKIVIAMLMAGQAALLNAAELKQACPDGMFMTTVGDCQGKKFKLCLFQLCLLKLFNRMLRQMSHLFKQL
jgi:hypothetical protein